MLFISSASTSKFSAILAVLHGLFCKAAMSSLLCPACVIAYPADSPILVLWGVEEGDHAVLAYSAISPVIYLPHLVLAA